MNVSAMGYFSLAIAAIFVQNLVMVLLLPSNVFFSALKSPVSGLKYGVSVTAATTAASALGWVVNHFLLIRFGLSVLSPFAYLLVIAVVAVLAEVLFRFTPVLKKQYEKLFSVSAFSCAVLGLVLLNMQQGTKGFLGTVFYGFCAGIGYILALFTAANAMERVRFSTPPAAFKGLPIALVTASLISLAFMGFSGIQIPY